MIVESAKTNQYAVDSRAPDAEVIEVAARAIRDGLLVAFPTETVYGLGANALDADAVAGIFAAKGRPPDNPLIVHIAAWAQITTVASHVPSVAAKLADAFWPGPLTLVLPRGDDVPEITSAGLDTVAVRMPSHPVALALIAAAGCPIAAPSANRSGRPSPTLAEHVAEDLWGRVAVILDGGACGVGLESTVLDVTVTPPVLLRPGGVSAEALEAVIGPIQAHGAGTQQARRSPGTRYRHYAPQAKVVLMDPDAIGAEAIRQLRAGGRVGVMSILSPGTGQGLVWRQMPSTPDLYARELFAALRELDALGCSVIIAETMDGNGIGRAVMDRLGRAAAASEETLVSEENLL